MLVAHNIQGSTFQASQSADKRNRRALHNGSPRPWYQPATTATIKARWYMTDSSLASEILHSQQSYSSKQRSPSNKPNKPLSNEKQCISSNWLKDNSIQKTSMLFADRDSRQRNCANTGARRHGRQWFHAEKQCTRCGKGPTQQTYTPQQTQYTTLANVRVTIVCCASRETSTV